LRVRHRMSRVRAPSATPYHTILSTQFFSSPYPVLTNFSTLRAPCRTLDSREDRRSCPNSLSGRDDNVIRAALWRSSLTKRYWKSVAVEVLCENNVVTLDDTRFFQNTQKSFEFFFFNISPQCDYNRLWMLW